MTNFTYNKTARENVNQYVALTDQRTAKVVALYDAGMRKGHTITPANKEGLSLTNATDWAKLHSDILATQSEADQAMAKMPNKSMAEKGTVKGDKQRADKKRVNNRVSKYVTDLGAKLAGLEKNDKALTKDGTIKRDADKRAPQIAKPKSVKDIRSAHTKLADACSDVTDHPNILEYTIRLAHAFEAIQGGAK